MDPFIAFHAKRQIDTGDSQDHPLLDDSRPHVDATPIIVAWGEEETMSFHGANTGRGIVRFFGPSVDMADAGIDPLLSLVEEEATGSFIATAEDYMIPLVETDYYELCLNLVDIPGAPTLNYTVHLIGVDFVPSMEVNGVDTSNHVHHFATFGASVPCEDPARFPQYFYDWGPGQPPLLFPDEVGIPIGNDGGFVSVNLQIHYDNLAAVSDLLDSTWVRLYYTSTLREHSAGVLFMGDPFTSLKPAPIGVGPTQHVLTCPGACTAFEFAQDHEPITVFTEAFHMHETGVRAVNEQIRDGEVVRESNVDFFDFWAGGIQQARQEPFALQAGDAFRTSCYYNAAKEGVLFGNGTRDEMCVAFLWYYPAISQTGLGFCGPGLGGFSGGACEGEYEEIATADDFNRTFGRIVGEDSSNAPATAGHWMFSLTLLTAIVALA